MAMELDSLRQLVEPARDTIQLRNAICRVADPTAPFTFDIYKAWYSCNPLQLDNNGLESINFNFAYKHGDARGKPSFFYFRAVTAATQTRRKQYLVAVDTSSTPQAPVQKAVTTFDNYPSHQFSFHDREDADSFDRSVTAVLATPLTEERMIGAFCVLDNLSSYVLARVDRLVPVANE